MLDTSRAGSDTSELFWFESLDEFLWTQDVLVTEQIRENAAWHGELMATGSQLMAEGANSSVRNQAL
ncbi:hypothetical protein BBD46_09800 [Natrialba sp. SSL1]|nr:hypothetical protein BBD46_09800 [Natrialba sp. SSL1]